MSNGQSSSTAPTADSTSQLSDDDVQSIDRLRDAFQQLRSELGRVVVGQTDVIEKLAICLFARGHALLMGVPGLAKTLLVSKLSETLALDFSRIQFTPDLMPMDITGTDILQDTSEGRREFEFVQGPIFANIVLADEINRAPPKTQAALLEAMQEYRVTALGKTFQLTTPFLVLATQNPVEQEGTYPLPEAQLDRFMFLIELDYPSEEEEIEIARTTTGGDLAKLNEIMSGEDIVRYQNLVRRIPVPDHIYTYATRLSRRTRPNGGQAPDWLPKLVSWGAGPRAVQNLILAAKARAALQGSYMVRLEDVQAAAGPGFDSSNHHNVCRAGRGHAGQTDCGTLDCRNRSYRSLIRPRFSRRVFVLESGGWSRSFIDPAALGRLSAVPLLSRTAMQGSVSGRHPSPHRGSSVEFAEYRKYVPGDDLRRVDWRALGRTDRYYVKEFEADTNLRCCLVLDTSGSMGFGSTGTSKIEFSRQLAATLGYLVVQQGDAIGLACVADGKVAEIPARRNPAHLSAVFDILEQTNPKGDTQLIPILHELAETNRQRALIVVLSDCFVDPSLLRGCFEHLRFRKHDVALFHMLDPMELAFEFQRPMRFNDMEGGTAIFTDPTEIADRYHTALSGYLKDVEQIMLECAVDYHRIRLDQDYEQVLMDFLVGRHELKGRR